MDELRYPLVGFDRLRMETDGEGVTTLVAGGGCPLSCHYCINKKLLAKAPAEHVTVSELYKRVSKSFEVFARRNGIFMRRPALPFRGKISSVCAMQSIIS